MPLSYAPAVADTSRRAGVTATGRLSTRCTMSMTTAPGRGPEPSAAVICACGSSNAPMTLEGSSSSAPMGGRAHAGLDHPAPALRARLRAAPRHARGGLAQGGRAAGRCRTLGPDRRQQGPVARLGDDGADRSGIPVLAPGAFEAVAGILRTGMTSARAPFVLRLKERPGGNGRCVRWHSDAPPIPPGSRSRQQTRAL